MNPFGGDIKAVSKDGLTALHFAAGNKDVDVMQFVIHQGLTDVDILSKNNLTALSVAINYHNPKLCGLLLKYGANANLKTGLRGHAPLEWISYLTGRNSRLAYIAILLLENGAILTEEILQSMRRRVIKGRIDKTADYILHFYVRHMARVDVLARSQQTQNIDKSLQRLMSGVEWFKTEYNDCLEELQNMTTTMVFEKMSMFCLLTASKKLAVGYARNKELRHNLGKLMTQFPIYYSFLEVKFRPLVAREELLEPAQTLLSEILSFNGASHVINRQILRFLSDQDLACLNGVNKLKKS